MANVTIDEALQMIEDSHQDNFSLYHDILSNLFKSFIGFFTTFGFWLLLGLTLAAGVALAFLIILLIVSSIMACWSRCEDKAKKEGRAEGRRERDLEASRSSSIPLHDVASSGRDAATDAVDERSSLTGGAVSPESSPVEEFTPGSTIYGDTDDTELDEQDPLHEAKGRVKRSPTV